MQGWRSEDERFVPDRDSPAFRLLVDGQFWGANQERWVAASETPLTLSTRAENLRTLGHPAAIAPPCGIPEGWPDYMIVLARQLESGHWVHGTILGEMFMPLDDCPNRNLLTPELKLALGCSALDTLA